MTEALRAEIARRKESGASEYDVAVMEAVHEAICDYPVAQVAERTVAILVGDMLQRKGLSECLLSLPEFDQLKKYWIRLLQIQVKAPPPPFAPDEAPKVAAPPEQFELTEAQAPQGETLDF
jgi:hypothetical protein